MKTIITMILVLILVMSSVSAFYVKQDSYQAEANYQYPVIFVPGVMGSILEDDNRWIMSDELWPGNPQENRMELAFQDDGRTPVIAGSDITPTGVMRSAWGSAIYEGFYNYMDTSTQYRYRGEFDGTGFMRQAYFDHAYDFRLPSSLAVKSGIKIWAKN